MTKAKHLKVIEFEQDYTPFTKMEMVALFNSSRIDEEIVREQILNGVAEHNDFIVVMFKSQYERLFDFDESKNDDFYNDLRLEQREQM